MSTHLAAREPLAEPIGVYIHIPYCRTICPYCDFVKERIRGNVPGSYVQALQQEIDCFEGPRDVVSVFLGGGTPSLLSPHALAGLIEAIGRCFTMRSPEITVEANPDDITPALVRDWRRAGVNRVSIGVQSFDDQTLAYLGRRHDAAAARIACEAVGEVLENWNLDLIFGAPPIDAWTKTLSQVLELDPPHIAGYSLTYEPGTPFGRRTSARIPDDEALRMYQEMEEAFSGYEHYEISNFCKPGHASAHNLIYWRNESYAGFGTGAYSYINGIRARNHPNTARYLLDPGGKEESLLLSESEVKVETLIQHFRLRNGLPKAYYTRRFGRKLHEDYPLQIQSLKARGLLEESETHVYPTSEGFYLNNEIGLALVS